MTTRCLRWNLIELDASELKEEEHIEIILCATDRLKTSSEAAQLLEDKKPKPELNDHRIHLN